MEDLHKIETQGTDQRDELLLFFPETIKEGIHFLKVTLKI